MASSGAEGPIAVTQHGLMVHSPTLALIGEAGPEAVVPLRHGVIPAKITARGLQAVLPSGDRMPIALPTLAMDGMVGQPLAPPAGARRGG
jgi:hypothetical protein